MNHGRRGRGRSGHLCAAIVGGVLALSACSSDEKKKPAAQNDAGSGDGSSGASGAAGGGGTSGTAGTSGSAGASASGGASGTSGGAGTSGASGAGGSAGVDGGAGTSGASGGAGVDGGAGTSGASGGAGVDGGAGTSGASGSAGVDGAAGTSGSAGAAGGDAGVAAAIAAFSGPGTACTGMIDLAYDFSGGSGVITPGNIAVPVGSGVVQAPLTATTTYTLTVTPSQGSPVTAQVSVTAATSPDATISAAAALGSPSLGRTASVPSQPGKTYAWTAASGNVTVTAGASQNSVTFDVARDPAATASLKVVVTDPVTSCSSTATVDVPIAIWCDAPEPVSFDRSAAPGAPQYTPINMGTRPLGSNVAGDIWAPYLVHQPSQPGYGVFDFGFSRSLAGGAWGAPAGAPLLINSAGSRVYDVKIATDDAGDAVFVWIQTTDNNTFTAQIRAYRASDATWSAAQTVASDVYSWNAQVFVQMNAASGVALVGWVQAPFNSGVPHLRTYAVATNALGADVPMRATTTNNYPPDMMALDLETNRTLDGVMTWYERDNVSGVVSLYGVHLTAGVVDTSGANPDVQTLAAGGNTSVDDVVNSYSVPGTMPQYQANVACVSDDGHAAVVWNVYNASSTQTNKATLYVRRYAGGSWGGNEIADAAPADQWNYFECATDNAGDVLIASMGFNDYRLVHGAHAAAFDPPVILATNGASTLAHVAMDSATGRGFVTFKANGSPYPHLSGRFWDEATATLTPEAVVEDPTQSSSEPAMPLFNAAGNADVAFEQAVKPPPTGSDSSNAGRAYVERCR